MTSEVDICNSALAHLGDSATVASIDPPEGSAQAEHCARWYPIARNSLLELHEWSFATVRAQLAELATPVAHWAHAYARPINALKILSILSPTDCETCHSYVSESDGNGDQIILTNLSSAVVRYTRMVTDTTKFSPLFVDVLGWYLSTYLAGPILKGESAISVANANMSKAMGMLALAKLSDTAQQHLAPVPVHAVPWLEGR